MAKINKATAYKNFISEGANLSQHDVIGNREQWSIYVDQLHRDGIISSSQVNTWTYPRNRLFYKRGSANYDY